MTGEQKPGGLEPYGWIYETFAPGAGWCAGPEWWPAKFTRTPPNPETTRNVIALYTTPAEPAEARIRELEADRALAWSDARKSAAAAASANARATAAEAKVQELKADKAAIVDLIAKACDLPPQNAVNTLKEAVRQARALQQEGE